MRRYTDLAPAKQGQLHGAISKKGYTKEEILAIIIAMFGCPNPSGSTGAPAQTGGWTQ
jgi:hypothetical protein